MQNAEVAALGNSVDLINVRAKDIRKTIEDFLNKLDKEQSTITWPNVLDNFAVISGQITTLLNFVKSDKTPPLQNFPIVPQRLSPDTDPQLLWLTDGRVSLMSHSEVPDYLRTKPDPEVEQAEKQLAVEVASHGDQASSSTQVTVFNKQCNKVLDKIKQRFSGHRDAFSRTTSAPTVNARQTQELFATLYYGRGMKLVPTSSSNPGVIS